MDYITNPAEIERESFARISDGLEGQLLDERNLAVIKRVIHTTADFDYAQNLVFSPDVMEKAKSALAGHASIVTDTEMAKAGISKSSLAQLGCTLHCFIGSEEVAARAAVEGSTRAWAAVGYAAEQLTPPLVYVVGNAPTALIRLHELVVSGALEPALIIAVPVGFVNVVESKELILGLDVPHIVARGQKGGSNVAAAIINALLYEVLERVV